MPVCNHAICSHHIQLLQLVLRVSDKSTMDNTRPNVTRFLNHILNISYFVLNSNRIHQRSPVDITCNNDSIIASCVLKATRNWNRPGFLPIIALRLFWLGTTLPTTRNLQPAVGKRSITQMHNALMKMLHHDPLKQFKWLLSSRQFRLENGRMHIPSSPDLSNVWQLSH